MIYDCDSKIQDGQFDVRLLASTSSRAHYEITFPAPLPAGFDEGNTVYVDYFVPQKAGKVPLVILVPGYGDESIAPCLTMARLLVKQSLATMVLYLPIHSRRLPEDMKGGVSPGSPQAWLDTYRSAVMEIRRLVDWAATREEIDSARVGVAGFSLGGMVSSIAMALDKRISAGIFIVIGGNMERCRGGVKETWIGTRSTRKP